MDDMHLHPIPLQPAAGLPSPTHAAAPRAPGQEIVLCPDGPLLVRGDFEILDASGNPVPRTRKTVALCRCGGSGIKPFCDGTHKVNGFRSGD
jgi:hypothetical protein